MAIGEIVSGEKTPPDQAARCQVYVSSQGTPARSGPCMEVQLGFPTPQKKKLKIPVSFACPVGTPCLAAGLLSLARGAHPGPKLWLIPAQHPAPARALGISRALRGGTWLSPQWGGHRTGGVRGEGSEFFSAFFWVLSAHSPESRSAFPSHSNSSRLCPHLTPTPAPLPPSSVFSLPSSFCSSSSPVAVAHCVCVCACTHVHVSCLCHLPCLPFPGQQEY